MAAIPVMLKSSIAKPGLELVDFVHLIQISWPLVTVADKLAFIGVKFPVAFPSNEPAVPVFGPVKFKAVVVLIQTFPKAAKEDVVFKRGVPAAARVIVMEYVFVVVPS